MSITISPFDNILGRFEAIIYAIAIIAIGVIFIVLTVMFGSPFLLAVLLSIISVYLISRLPEDERSKYVWLPIVAFLIGFILGKAYNISFSIVTFSITEDLAVDSNLLFMIFLSGFVIGVGSEKMGIGYPKSLILASALTLFFSIILYALHLDILAFYMFTVFFSIITSFFIAKITQPIK